MVTNGKMKIEIVHMLSVPLRLHPYASNIVMLFSGNESLEKPNNGQCFCEKLALQWGQNKRPYYKINSTN